MSLTTSEQSCRATTTYSSGTLCHKCFLSSERESPITVDWPPCSAGSGTPCQHSRRPVVAVASGIPCLLGETCPCLALKYRHTIHVPTLNNQFHVISFIFLFLFASSVERPTSTLWRISHTFFSWIFSMIMLKRQRFTVTWQANERVNFSKASTVEVCTLMHSYYSMLIIHHIKVFSR